MNRKIYHEKESIRPVKYPRDKTLAPQSTREKKIWIHEIQKYLDPQTTYKKKKWPIKYPREKFRTHKKPTKKNFGPTKYPRENILDPRNTCEKKYLDPQNTHKKTFWTQETPARKNFEPTKYPRRYDGTMALDPQEPQWHMIHKI